MRCPLTELVDDVGRLLTARHGGRPCPEADQVRSTVCAGCTTLVRLFVAVSNVCTRNHGCTAQDDHGGGCTMADRPIPAGAGQDVP